MGKTNELVGGTGRGSSGLLEGSKEEGRPKRRLRNKPLGERQRYLSEYVLPQAMLLRDGFGMEDRLVKTSIVIMLGLVSQDVRTLTHLLLYNPVVGKCGFVFDDAFVKWAIGVCRKKKVWVGNLLVRCDGFDQSLSSEQRALAFYLDSLVCLDWLDRLLVKGEDEWRYDVTSKSNRIGKHRIEDWFPKDG